MERRKGEFIVLESMRGIDKHGVGSSRIHARPSLPVGRRPPSAKFPCRSITLRPEEYFPDKISGLDGAVVRSQKERRSVLVRGISPEKLAELAAFISWTPDFSYELSFTDRRTEAPESFHVVSRIDTPELGTARFGLA
jgi:hypothetical protein